MTDEKIKTNGKIQRKLVTKNIWDCRVTVGQTLIFRALSWYLPYSPIYLHLIFEILQFKITILMGAY